MVSDSEAKPTTEKLFDAAKQELQNAHEKQAMALAIEAGELTEQQAEELLEMDELAVVNSDYYPGDEFYDRAAAQLRRHL